jgi:Tol biopolymer transport system component
MAGEISALGMADNVYNLLNEPGRIVSPVFPANDNETIIYCLVNETANRSALYQFKTTVSEKSVVADSIDGIIAAIAPSPAGGKLAYIVAGSGGKNLVLYDLENGEAISLVSNAQMNDSLVFSPGGNYVVYTTAANAGTYELWAVSVTGGRPHKLAGLESEGRLEPIIWLADGEGGM